MSWIPQAENLFFYYFVTFEIAVLGMIVLQTVIIHILLNLREKKGE